jgi:hypothetical protein
VGAPAVNRAQVPRWSSPLTVNIPIQLSRLLTGIANRLLCPSLSIHDIKVFSIIWSLLGYIADVSEVYVSSSSGSKLVGRVSVNV